MQQKTRLPGCPSIEYPHGNFRLPVWEENHMAYTALRKMRQMNQEEFGKDLGPMEPYRYGGETLGSDLKSAALRFLHDRCEDLRFDPEIEAEEEETCTWKGTSIAPGQIPYNMQMDIDRLCLERELEHFIDSGIAEDAYTVYYCYLEMFFGRYGKSKKMVELLSEFEANGSSLLLKHRDHYSHSVYVFVLGLAIYETNEPFRRAFKTFYGFDPDAEDEKTDHLAACFFLEYWGLTALFHDIGYPFELPFEQVMSYYEVNHKTRGENSLFIGYRNVDVLTKIDSETAKQFEKLYGRSFHSVTELLSYDIARKLGKAYGFTEGYLMNVLEKKPREPEKFGYFMDHAFFSAARLYVELADTFRGDLTKAHVDALSAILLHNSLYKFSIAFYKDHPRTKPTLKMDLHPLAYLLMLCDELQCWDRTAYGRNSRTELQPMAVQFDFSGNSIHANYLFDEDEKGKITAYEKEYAAWKKNPDPEKKPRLKAYSSMAGKDPDFQKDIERIVDTSLIPLTVECGLAPASRENKHIYLSVSNFLHIHDFSVALNARYSYEGKEDKVSTEQLESEFEALSLEYKLSNINQVKSFSRYLNVIHCFYTDRPVLFDMLREFTPEQINLFGPLEHERWIREHQSMGWRCDDTYEHVKVPRGVNRKAYKKMLREQMRCHALAMDGNPTSEEIRAHYFALPESEREKDWKPFNSMLKLIRKFDGLRIYLLDD